MKKRFNPNVSFDVNLFCYPEIAIGSDAKQGFGY
jgi:hypothetical protein